MKAKSNDSERCFVSEPEAFCLVFHMSHMYELHGEDISTRSPPPEQQELVTNRVIYFYIALYV